MLLIALFLTLLASCIAIFFTLLGTTSRSSDPDEEQPPKVVSLGYVQSGFLWIRCLWNQSVPNYELSEWLTTKYGKILIIKKLFKRQVTLNIAHLAAAKYIMNSSAWANRFPSDYYLYTIVNEEPLGTFFGNGGYWKEGRKTTLRLLHKFGFFREEVMEKIVQHQAKELCEKEFAENIQKKGGNGEASAVLRVHQMFQIYTLNIVSEVILGRRFDRGDPTVQRLLSGANAFNEVFNNGTNVLDVFPWLQHLPSIPFRKGLIAFNRVFMEFLQKEVIGCRRRKPGSYARTNPPDFVDSFFLEVDRKRGENPCYLNESNVLACLRDLFSGGLDSTNVSLEHALLHVCLQPGIQRKVQEEIDQVIGDTREPSYKDQKMMPYTQAVLLETLRFATPVPGVTRCPLRDVEIPGNHVILKDSLVGINLYAIHHSTEVWTDPECFRPERFLNEKNEVVNQDKIMPFGYGKRVCVAEFSAKMTLFILFVSIVQKFKLELSKEHRPPSMKNKMGLSRAPFPYYINIAHRSHVQM